MHSAHGTIFTAGEKRPSEDGVGQDNGVIDNARLKQAEPAHWQETSRAHQCCEYISPADASFSPQKRAAKTEREKITAWVPRALAHEIKRVAAVNQVSVSIVATRYLELGTLQSIHTQQAALLLPILQQAIRTQMRRQSELNLQTQFDVNQIKRLIYNLLARAPEHRQMSEQTFNTIRDKSQQDARKDLRHRMTSLQTIFGEELEQFLAAPPDNAGTEEHA